MQLHNINPFNTLFTPSSFNAPFNPNKPLMPQPMPADIFVRNVAIKAGAIQQTQAALQRLYGNWGLSSVGNNLMLMQGGLKTIVQSHSNPLVLEKIRALFKPPNVSLYHTKQGTNGDCHILATLQDMMITGKQMDALIRAISVEPNPRNCLDDKYTIRFYDNQKKPKEYTYTLEELHFYSEQSHHPKVQQLGLPESHSHPLLVNLLRLALRPFTFETGFNNFTETNLPQKMPGVHDPFWTDAGITGKLLEALDPNASVYCVSSEDNGELDWYKEQSFNPWLPFDIKVSIFQKLAAAIADRKPSHHPFLSFEQIETLCREQSQNLLGLSILKQTTVPSALEAQGIVTEHGYTLLGANPNRQTVTILNPHNSTKPLALQKDELIFTQATVAIRPPTSKSLMLVKNNTT